MATKTLISLHLGSQLASNSHVPIYRETLRVLISLAIYPTNEVLLKLLLYGAMGYGIYDAEHLRYICHTSYLVGTGCLTVESILYNTLRGRTRGLPDGHVTPILLRTDVIYYWALYSVEPPRSVVFVLNF